MKREARLTSPPLRLPEHVRQSPRLDRLQRTSAFNAAKTASERIEGKPHRDFRKLALLA